MENRDKLWEGGGEIPMPDPIIAQSRKLEQNNIRKKNKLVTYKLLTICSDIRIAKY